MDQQLLVWEHATLTKIVLLFIPSLFISLLVHRIISDYLKLRHVPGPFFAAFSNLPRVSWVLSKRAHNKHIELHEKYGDLVRFGPNMVSCSDPTQIPTIYPLKGRGFVKSQFYKVLLPYSKGKSLPSLFGTDDEDIHKALKKPISGIFSMSNLVTFEPYVDSTIQLLLEQLDRRFVLTGEACDFGQWLQMFAFDVMGELTFSRKFGFLKEGRDVDGVMEKIWEHFKTAAPVTQMPWIDRFWNKNPLLVRFWPSTASPIMAFARQRVLERQAAEKDWDEASETNPRDFLSRFVEAQAKDSSVPDWAVTVWVFSNITAGSDSTAVVLRCIWYNLLHHPETLAELRRELERADLSQPCKWKEVHELPYLTACIKEGIRMHPPFGLPFERVVPAGGAVISGKYLEEGTVVGMSAWVANRNKAIFGHDAERWNPGRWCCDDGRRKEMENAILTFGAGKRQCLGRHIAYLEMFKLIPSLVQAYNIEPIESEGWTIENLWFVTQKGLKARLSKRVV
ncbi:uncharacterized protein K452DRAFT_293104 [Aplosporella prunicola CBS 121167]|uniref:Uncharacterized protein n=1 Tax=Aplosporella prunicola CBS 121167 TaxID=1176127 RepID=A0A6A6AX87_9PEZI|nr:uncharacterized protein K452DRAFT_293104 [Aplosporella prunicola CBS 121167]KAF2135595.1 hypothetical protein K452DRAFT_293104 [Aplosporella prunicola CBS 121167]